MAQIQATFSALQSALQLTPDDQRRRSQTLADLTLAEWSAFARRRLRSSLPAYLRSLQTREVSESGFVCGLPASPSTAILAHMVEQGMGSGGIGTSGPYDVRKYLLRSSTRNIRRKKNGELYLRVPFGHDPKVVKQQHGARIRSAMQRLRATTTDANRSTRYGGRLPAGLVPRLKPHHVADPLAGMVRTASTYSKGNGRPRSQTSGYRTWRTASYSNTHPDAWMSSGITARRIVDDVLQTMPTLVSQVF